MAAFRNFEKSPSQYLEALRWLWQYIGLPVSKKSQLINSLFQESIQEGDDRFEEF